ncbi:MAG: hypothetical protein J6Y33_07255 [Prevotella sp.]|nr:hypothetical protein [Prevotella sp.]
MKEENFDKVGADNPLQSMKDFGAQLMNFINGYQQALAENEQLRQRAAKLESENAALAETIEQWKKNGAKERVLRLVDAYGNAVQKQLSE